MNNNNKMGIWGAPGTFPTQKLQAEIYSQINKLWERHKINEIYFIYKEAVMKKGFQSWPEGGGPLVEHMESASGYDIGDIRIFLMMLMNLADRGEIDKRFFNIELQKLDPPVAENIIQSVAAGTGDISGIFKQIKFIGIIALIGIGVYLTWPLLTGARKRLARG